MATKIYNISKVQALDNFHVIIDFEDGFKKEINLQPFIGNGVSAALANPEYFKQVKIDFGTLVWGNGFELCPVTLRNF